MQKSGFAFSTVQPAIMGKVLGIVYRIIATHLAKKAGYTKTTAHTGAVTLIQRFGSALTKLPGREAPRRAGLPRKANLGFLTRKGSSSLRTILNSRRLAPMG